MNARHSILEKLRAAQAQPKPALVAEDYRPVAEAHHYTTDERIARFKRLMQEVKTEIHDVGDDWPATLARLMCEKQLSNLLIAPETVHGAAVVAHWQMAASLPPLKAYEANIESWREEMFFNTAASLTACRAGIAASGSLVLWPTPQEPRLMSLVPPVHFALLEADQIVDNLPELMEKEHWAQSMPTNALLISGPSKTADIQQTLAYGAHGPKELVVLLKHS